MRSVVVVVLVRVVRGHLVRGVQITDGVAYAVWVSRTEEGALIFVAQFVEKICCLDAVLLLCDRYIVYEPSTY